MTSHFRRGNHYASKLSPAQVVDMRRDYAEGMTQGDLAKKYDMGVSSVGRVVRGESWRHISSPRPEPTDQEIHESMLRVMKAAGLEMPASDTVAPEPSAAPAPPIEPTREHTIDGRPVADIVAERYGLHVKRD